MSDRFLIRQLAQLGLTANAFRPAPGAQAAIPAFFAGWLTGELAPHIATLTAVDAAQHVARHGLRTRSDRLGAAAAVGSVAGLTYLANSGHRAKLEIQTALIDALGPGYLDVLAPQTLADDATPWRAIANPFRMRNPEVRVRRNVQYAPGGRRLQLNVYHHRDTPAGAPVLLQVHGGGWVIGNKDQQGIPLMLHMAARGWVCVSANYPLSPKHRWPDHMVALKQALAWIRTSAHEYGADPSFVASTGGSAGGHLSALLALTANDPLLQPGFEDADTSIQACAPHYGVYDFTAEDGTRASRERLESLIKRMVMRPDAVYPDDYMAASPIYRITPDAPPFLVIHGSNDTLVPVHDARVFVDALRATSKNQVAYAEIKGAQHAFDIFPSIRSAHVLRGVQRFLDWSYLTREDRPNVAAKSAVTTAEGRGSVLPQR